MQQLKPRSMLLVEVVEVGGTLNDNERKSSFKQVGNSMHALSCSCSKVPSELEAWLDRLKSLGNPNLLCRAYAHLLEALERGCCTPTA